ncbi:MAG: hypothetical protein K6F77_10230 [Lachnospiraceae bacterium]|nr:hypothetical protein [Lachnospiraceae bacterium]
MKFIYKFFGLIVIFLGACLLFSRNIPTLSLTTSSAADLMSSTYPTVSIEMGDFFINNLTGYNSAVNASTIRESITPIDTSKEFTLSIVEKSKKIESMTYTLLSIPDNIEMYSEEVSDFDEGVDKKHLSTPIFLDTALDTSTEYALHICLSTDSGADIHYYTRIKYYESDFFLSKKLDFISDFHEATFSDLDEETDESEDAFDISSYLETSYENKYNESLANVSIYSNSDLIKWNGLPVKTVTTPVPTIKELNIEGASVLMSYYVTIKINKQTYLYYVEEFYRLRYSSGQMYLLYFERNMDQIFDASDFDYKDNVFNLGLSSETDFNLTCDSENKYMSFTKNGSLWFFDTEKNKLVQVFSINDSSNILKKKSSTSDNNKPYQYDIKIIDVHDNGDIDFVFCGYLNSGDYEGHVAIILYKYNATDDELTERLYIPLTKTYQRLDYDFGDFCYVNEKNVFYFELDDKVYTYNLSSKKYAVLSDNANENTFAMLKDACAYVFSNATEDSYATSLSILNLSTDEEVKISAPNNDKIRVLGTVENNIIYGLIREKDISKDESGETILPVYKTIIADCSGKILKKYSTKNHFVDSVETNGNVVTVHRLKRKPSGKYKKASDDTILSQNPENTSGFYIDDSTEDEYLKTTYIHVPTSAKVKSEPKYSKTDKILIDENTTFRITDENENTYYYTYTHGNISERNSSPAKAILSADEGMGVVLNSKGELIWERAGQFLSKKLSGISDSPATSKISSAKSCCYLLLKAAQVTVKPKELEGKNVLTILSDYLPTAVNLSGCNVKETLYFISNERPVIAKIGNDHYVVLKEYTETTITWYDPESDSDKTASLDSAYDLFKEQGNVFVSFI